MQVVAQLIGYPRIGPNRELKWALERMWSRRMERHAFDARIAELRIAHLDEQRDLIGAAVDDFWLYDQVLETAMMLGLVPDDLAADLDDDPFAVLTALARGTPQREAWEMTKWFDTNYHYVVPEIGRPVGELRPLPWREPLGRTGTTWAILGPYSLVKLSKLASGVDAEAVARSAGEALWRWLRDRAAEDPGFRVQLDEPCLGLTMDDQDRSTRQAAYAGAADLGLDTVPLVTVQFGAASAETISALGGLGLAVQRAAKDRGEAASGDGQPEHVITVMDGRSVWPDDFEPTRQIVEALPDDGRTVRIVPSTSLMFLPYTVEG
ncbi:MAG: hypothetical protein ACRDGB_05460, partial [Candidatus Limnocylindria bacterium]